MRTVQPGSQNDPLVDFRALALRLRTAAMVLAVAALTGALIEGLVVGLMFAVLARWTAIYVAALLVCAALLVAANALRGATTAQRRGERLSGPDVGFLPSRRPRGDDREPGV